MKRIGLLGLALVLALGALGVGYAHWSDTIFINGTVTTGSLDLVVEALCGTEVYKDLKTGELVYSHWVIQLPDGTKYYYDDAISSPPPANGLLVGSVNVTQDLSADPSGDTLVMEFDNLFPLEGYMYGLGWGNWIGNCRIHALGTVPMHVNVTTEVTGIPPDWVEIYFYPFFEPWEPLTPKEFDGIQLHECMEFEVWVMVSVPQKDAAMRQTGTITIEIEGIQWNKYPLP